MFECSGRLSPAGSSPAALSLPPLVDWIDGVFDALEHLVNSKPQNQIEAFAQSGELRDLYEGQMIPTLPSESHKRYLQAYAASQSVQEAAPKLSTPKQNE